MQNKRVPIARRLKRRQHIELARLQDIAMESLYRVFPESVLHGGTAIWRCYSGSRFSEDVDVYFERENEKIEELFEEFKAAGFEVTKKRVKERSLYSRLVLGNVEMRFEAFFKKVKGVIKEYETYEGILLNIYTLLPEDIILEKVDAYLGRKKIRDLYDIFFLLRYVKESGKVKPKLKALMGASGKPADEKELKTLILFGIAPKSEEMLDYIKRWSVEIH